VTASAAPVATRRYRGSSAPERRAQRREQLIRAAIDVYGERGYRNATVKAVCEAAGLTERYFYESFANSEALLVASYRAVTGILLKTLQEAGDAAGGDAVERAQAILARYFEALRNDPPSARLFLVEIAGVSAELDRVFAASLEAFGVLLARTLGTASGGGQERLLRTAAVGGIIHLAFDWVARGYVETHGEVVAAALRLALLLRPGTAP
jgi:AcrR family transcriptional regulator